MTMLTRMGGLAALVAACAAGPALADQGGIPHNGGGQGADHAAQPATPAQPGPPGDGATPATPAQPAAKAPADSEQKKAKPHKARHHQTEQGTVPSSHAKAGKTTICHATGSQTNPYVEITISNNALPAHRRHQDGRDIIPANGPCPAGAATTQSATKTKTKTESASSKSTAGKTTICHATGSVTNPFVKITISDHALDAHRRHHDGEDVIPAPDGDCPAVSQAQATRQETAGSTQSGEQSAVLTQQEQQAAADEDKPQSGVLAERITRAGVADEAADDAAGADTDDDASTGTLAAEDTAPAAERSSGLPFTGMDLGIVAAVGAALMLAGTALRRARRIRVD